MSSDFGIFLAFGCRFCLFVLPCVVAAGFPDVAGPVEEGLPVWDLRVGYGDGEIERSRLTAGFLPSLQARENPMICIMHVWSTCNQSSSCSSDTN